MAKTTNKMSLKVWSSLTDDFDHEQLADNWAKLDAHDHTNGRGVQIPSEGIFNGAVTFEKLSPTLQGQVFSETESYASAETVKSGKPVNAVTRTLVQVSLTQIAESVKLEIKVSGDASPILTYESGAAGIKPFNFFVPGGHSWEWVKVAGTELNITFSYRALVL